VPYLFINKNQAIALSFTYALLALSLPQNCLAQQSDAGAGQSSKPMSVQEALKKQWPKPAAKPAPYVDTFGKPEMLTADKAVFDDIPPYTGKAKFQTGGLYAPGGSNGALKIVTYTVTEPKSQVKDWYANALRMYGWNVTFQSDTAINATNGKSGNTVTMQFCDDDPSPGHKGHSMLQIDYHSAVHQ